MAPFTGAYPSQGPQRVLNAVEQAMMEELSKDRIERMPCDDETKESRRARLGPRPGDRREYGRPSPFTTDITQESMRSVQSQPSLTSAASIWRAAIDSGAFDDDDAAAVKGLDTIAGGQLSRIRRQEQATGVAQKITQAMWSPDGLRRDKTGQVPPRVGTYNPNLYRPSPIGLSHKGDGPVAVSGRSRLAPRPTTLQQQHGTGVNASSSGRSTANDLPPTQAITPVQPSPATNTPQPQHDKFRVPRPGPESVIFQKTIKLMPTGVRRKVPGTIYLASACAAADGTIVILVDDASIDDVQWSIKKYDDLKTFDDKALALSFKVGGGCLTWFVVEFGSRYEVMTFVEALRKLEQWSLAPASAAPAIEQVAPTVEKVETQEVVNKASAVPSATVLRPVTCKDVKPIAEPIVGPVVVPATIVDQTANAEVSSTAELVRLTGNTDGRQTETAQEVEKSAEDGDDLDMMKKELLKFMNNTIMAMRASPRGRLIDDADLPVVGHTLVASFFGKTSSMFNDLEAEYQAIIVDYYKDIIIDDFLRSQGATLQGLSAHGPVQEPVRQADRVREPTNQSETSECTIPRDPANVLARAQENNKGCGPIQNGVHRPVQAVKPTMVQNGNTARTGSSSADTRIVYHNEHLMGLRKEAMQPPDWLHEIDYLKNAHSGKKQPVRPQTSRTQPTRPRRESESSRTPAQSSNLEQEATPSQASTFQTVQESRSLQDQIRTAAQNAAWVHSSTQTDASDHDGSSASTEVGLNQSSTTVVEPSSTTSSAASTPTRNAGLTTSRWANEATSISSHGHFTGVLEQSSSLLRLEVSRPQASSTPYVADLNGLQFDDPSDSKMNEHSPNSANSNSSTGLMSTFAEWHISES